jgi:hypothetical protein
MGFVLAPSCGAGRDAVSAAIAEGKHPVPFRTRKLSPPAPMVLPRRRGGRVGRRRDTIGKTRAPRGGPFLCSLDAFSSTPAPFLVPFLE